MIRVRIDFESMELSMDGHAEHQRNEEGHDLVCAAASMMVYAMIATMEEQQRCGRLRELHVEAVEGHARVQAEPKTEEWKQVMARFETIADGLRLLMEQYPGHIMIEYE